MSKTAPKEAQNTTEIVLKSTAPSEQELSWIKHAQTEKQNEAKRLEDTAKFLVGIVSISLSIFITKRPENLAFTVTAVVWLFSVLASFFVFFPFRYDYREDEPKSIKDAYAKVVRYKQTALIASFGLFFLALCLAIYATMSSYGS